MCLLRGTDWIFIYNSTFCPHRVFLCFLWIWEQTAIISLYSVDWLVFITETECVYCAVRTKSLYIILRSAHTVCLLVLCGSENKQWLYPYTALTDWFYNWDGVFTARYGLGLYINKLRFFFKRLNTVSPKSFICPTNAQLISFKMLKFTLRFTVNTPTCFGLTKLSSGNLQSVLR